MVSPLLRRVRVSGIISVGDWDEGTILVSLAGRVAYTLPATLFIYCLTLFK
jgi:hypothetical protein